MRADNETDELMTIQTFAERYRVDVSVVRTWIKAGLIPFTLQGTRKMVRRSDILRPAMPPVDPQTDPQTDPREVLVGILVTRDGMDSQMAHSVVDGMDPADIDQAIADQSAEGGHDGGTD